MINKVYDTIIEQFCVDDFYFENIRLRKPNGMFKTIDRDYDLFVLNNKRVLFFARLKDGLSDFDVVVELRASLNFAVDKLSLSPNKFIVCGANNDKLYFFNKYNDRLFVFDLQNNEGFDVIEYIENELSYDADEFDYDTLRSMRDSLILSNETKELSKSKEKIKTGADGKTFINKHGAWREASEINTQTLYLLTVFGGMFGVHLFYQKKRAKAALYLITYGLFGIGWFFDSLEILLGIYKDPEGKYLTPICNKLTGFATLLAGAVVFGLLGFGLMFLLEFFLEGSSNVIMSVFTNIQ